VSNFPSKKKKNDPHTDTFYVIIMMKLVLSSLALSSFFLVPASAQFTCTLKGAASEEVCVGTLDDNGAHCVWCSIGFSLCVDETTAESIEQSIPNAQCDRYSGSDDDKKPATDDASPATDDKPAPPSDDKIKPSDDTIPDNYWECLKQKDLKTCLADNCTWCNSKAGFSLCVGGPTADFAKKSDFYKCVDNNTTETTTGFTTNFLRASASATTLSQTTGSTDPYDMSCITAYLNDPTETGCTSAKDQEGQACEWCTMAGMANLCLTEEQAAVAGGMGVQCDGGGGGAAAAAPETASEAAIL